MLQRSDSSVLPAPPQIQIDFARKVDDAVNAFLLTKAPVQPAQLDFVNRRTSSSAGVPHNRSQSDVAVFDGRSVSAPPASGFPLHAAHSKRERDETGGSESTATSSSGPAVRRSRQQEAQNDHLQDLQRQRAKNSTESNEVLGILTQLTQSNAQTDAFLQELLPRLNVQNPIPLPVNNSFHISRPVNPIMTDGTTRNSTNTRTPTTVSLSGSAFTGRDISQEVRTPASSSSPSTAGTTLPNSVAEVTFRYFRNFHDSEEDVFYISADNTSSLQGMYVELQKSFRLVKKEQPVDIVYPVGTRMKFERVSKTDDRWIVFSLEGVAMKISPDYFSYSFDPSTVSPDND